MGTAGAEPIWANPVGKHDGAAGVFQIEQGEVTGNGIIPQKSPIKGKCRPSRQGYPPFQNRAGGAGLPGGIRKLGGGNSPMCDSSI